MGNYFSVHREDVYLDGFRIGSNGSISTIQALLLAGYAAGTFPESDRVRRRWLTERVFFDEDLGRLGYPHEVLRLTSFIEPSRNDLQQVINYDRDDAFWIRTQDRTIQRGLHLKPVRCPVLDSLLWIFRNNDSSDQWYCRLVGTAKVQQFAFALREVYPALQQTAWALTLFRMKEMIGEVEWFPEPELRFS